MTTHEGIRNSPEYLKWLEREVVRQIKQKNRIKNKIESLNKGLEEAMREDLNKENLQRLIVTVISNIHRLSECEEIE